MKTQLTLSRHLAVGLVCGLLACGTVQADKESSGKGQGKPDKHRSAERGHGGHDDAQGRRHDDHDDSHGHGEHHDGHVYFTHQHRVVINHYYADEYSRGRCPPGLAKKNNGCRPPGLAKQWHLGQPLPREVVYYPLPPQVLVNFGTPPPGAQFVRVANDILLIAIGTGMVLDALADLGGM